VEAVFGVAHAFLPYCALIKALEVINYKILYKVSESTRLTADDDEQQMIKGIQNAHGGEYLNVT